MDSREENKQMKVLVAVVDRGQGKKLSNILTMLVVEHYIIDASGTASPEIMELIGVSSVDKSLIYCFVPDSIISMILNIVSYKMEMEESGNGIAFTLPLESQYPYIEEGQLEPLIFIDKEWHDKMKGNGKLTDVQYSVVIAMINEGYSDALMEAAKEAGARGGTVFQAKRKGNEQTDKLLSLLNSADKEVVMILAKNDQKQNIIQKINEKCGQDTAIKASVFSMPVDDVTGIQ